MILNKRLLAIANKISDGSFVLDVGCDHALLGIYLKLKRNNIMVIGSDIHEGPIEKAKQNLKKYHLENEIELKIADGLDSCDKNIDTIVISGMGEETITEICTKGKEKLANIKNLILSPNNNFYELRKNITKLGFEIKDEELIKEKEKYYLIAHFIKGNKKYSEKKLFFGPILLKEKNELFLSYYEELYKKQKEILKSIPKEQKEKIKEIERYLRKINSYKN